jgi:hypothetical protein
LCLLFFFCRHPLNGRLHLRRFFFVCCWGGGNARFSLHLLIFRLPRHLRRGRRLPDNLPGNLVCLLLILVIRRPNCQLGLNAVHHLACARIADFALQLAGGFGAGEGGNGRVITLFLFSLFCSRRWLFVHRRLFGGAFCCSCFLCGHS